jgi:putative redox protein
MENANTSPFNNGAGRVVVRGSASGLEQNIVIGTHRLKSDEPVEAGGTDTGPSPYDLLLAALGSCKSMTLALYARRKQWPLEDVTVRLKHSRMHAADCRDCETKAGMLDRIEVEIVLMGPLTQEQRTRLRDIANKCPVHRTLTSEVKIESRLA